MIRVLSKLPLGKHGSNLMLLQWVNKILHKSYKIEQNE